MLSLSPILDICHELDYGGMYNFSGCYGSRKTSTLTKVITNHNRNQQHLSFYYNPTNFSETESVVKESGAWGFNNGDSPRPQRLASAAFFGAHQRLI